MVEAAQIAGFRQDGKSKDRTDAGDLLKALEVGVVLEVIVGPLFELITQLAEADHLAQGDAEHGHCLGCFLDGKADRRLRPAVNILQQALLGHFAANEGPGSFHKLFHWERSDRSRCRKGSQQLQQPLGTRGMVVALDFGEIERQIMREQAMLGARLFQGDLRVGQRQFLKVMDVMDQRIVEVLGKPGFEQMQQDLRVLGIVLIPGVVHGLAGAGHSYRRDQLQMKPFRL